VNDNVTIAGNLVAYLRRGIKRKMSEALEVLTVELDTSLDPEIYRQALTHFDDARALFDSIGATEKPEQAAIELALDRWGNLVLEALELEYDTELMRLQDAAAAGFPRPLRDLAALETLLAEIRKRVGAPPRRNQAIPASARHRRRTRGDAD
jgi:hypothetical protein